MNNISVLLLRQFGQKALEISHYSTVLFPATFKFTGCVVCAHCTAAPHRAKPLHRKHGNECKTNQYCAPAKLWWVC